MVALHAQSSDSLLTADNMMLGKSTSFGLFAPISTEIWKLFQVVWRGQSPRQQTPRLEERLKKGQNSQFPKSQG